jgi:hypothetical protein
MNYDSSANPNTVLSWPSSYSTWTAINGANVLASYYSADASFNLGVAGGYASIQSHNHQWYNADSGVSSKSIDTTSAFDNCVTYASNGTSFVTFDDNELRVDAYTTTTVGNASSNSNYPPYTVVAMWRRTA